MYRLLCIAILLASTTGSFSVFADETLRSRQLNDLFANLKLASSETQAKAVELEIWKLWTTTGDPIIDGLMQEALRARRWHDYKKALGFLDRLVELSPNYSEIWNQRATIYFLK